MVKSEIRLKYSGIVTFASHIVGVAVGLAFVLMVTRSVSTEEFGIWGNINDIYNYFILLSNVIPFWAARFAVREHPGSARTGLVANLFISVPATIIYLGLLPIILPVLKISSIYAVLYVIVSAQILELHILSALKSILRVKQPQTIGYALIVYEACRVLLGFVLIMLFELGLRGAVYSIIVSHVVEITFCMKLAGKELRGSFEWSYLKEWLKAAPINIYNVIGIRMATFTLILLFALGGELARAYYGAATSYAGIITYSSLLAYALYPRLLSENRSEDVSTSLKLVLTFAIPMATGVMVLSDSYLTILRAGAYVEATPVLLLLAINSLCLTLSQVINAVVTGTERVDAKAKFAFRELVRSRLFLLFTLPYLQSIVTLPTAYFVLASMAETPLEAATYLAMITLLSTSAMLIARYAIARKCLSFDFPWSNISKYVLASAAMAAVLLVIPHPKRLSTTVVFTLIGGALYLTLLLLIDKETRSLAKAILEEGMRVVNPKT